MRGQNLRAWMIKRHEQTPAPLENFSGCFSEIEFMILNAPQRFKRDAPHRDDNKRVNNLNLPAKEIGTVRYLSRGRRAICSGGATRITEHRVGDKNLRTRQTYRS